MLHTQSLAVCLNKSPYAWLAGYSSTSRFPAGSRLVIALLWALRQLGSAEGHLDGTSPTTGHTLDRVQPCIRLRLIRASQPKVSSGTSNSS